MTFRSAAALAATLTAALLGAAPAHAAKAETVRYRVAMDIAGTWSESVRADLDADDADHDGTEEVASRETSLRFALKATMPRVAFRDGRVVRPVYDVADASLVPQVTTSTFRDFYGTSGTCSPESHDASGGGEVAMAGRRVVFRPSSDAVVNLVCVDPFVKYGITIDLLRVAASKDVAPLGTSPIDAAFTIPQRRFGARRITIPVAASAAQRAFARCPREDPGHTVACPFAWTGTVTLERLGRGR